MVLAKGLTSLLPLPHVQMDYDNLKLTRDLPDIVAHKTTKECKAGRIEGPLLLLWCTQRSGVLTLLDGNHTAT